MSHPVSDLSKRAAHREPGVVLVIVPKDDEFRETLLAFDLTLADVLTLGERDQIEYVDTDSAGDRIVIACLDAQGNSESQTFASSMIDRFAPSFLCVTGTALGNPAYSSVGAVFASRQIYGLTQIRQTVRGSVYQDVTPTDVDKAVLWDFRDHIKTPASIAAVRESISQRATELSLPIDADRYTVDSEIIASGNEYFKSTTEHVERQLWERYPSVRAYDMESWGVVKAAERSNVDWLTFRGVSDFGVDGGMSEQQRQLAAYASAAVLRSFLDSPRTRMRQKAHARRVERDELPRSNFYVENSTSVASFQERISRDLGVQLGNDVLDRALTPADLVEVLVKAGADREEATLLLPVVHEEYFRDKYLNYAYRDTKTGKAVDSRALSRDWAKSIRDALAEFDLNTLFGKTAIDVGCGNGEELALLFPDVRETTEIILVDLAAEFLTIARTKLPAGTTRGIKASAASLLDVPDHSVDLYLSLRTFQSRMFDIDAAFREAYRITRAGGLIAISISNGYASTLRATGGPEREIIVPGLKASGLDRTVSQSAPYALADRLRKLFSRFGVSARQFDLAHGEILVCGRVGESYAADYYGA